MIYTFPSNYDHAPISPKSVVNIQKKHRLLSHLTLKNSYRSQNLI